MTRIYLMLLIFCITACTNETKQVLTTDTQDTTYQNVDNNFVGGNSTTWIENLREFRDAVYKGDNEKIKSFISFPILNDNNEIWYLVLQGENSIKLSPDTVKPFTEKDFERYYTKLFPKEFIKSFLKIKTETLYKTGETETAELSDDSTSTYQMFTSFDKTGNTLNLNLATKTKYKQEDLDTPEMSEFNIIYQFKILENQKLKFIQIRLAG